MSQTAFVSDQLASIQEENLNVPWKGTTGNVRYIKTARNNVYALVRDVVMIVSGNTDELATSKAMSQEILTMKYKISADLRGAIEKVFV